VAAGRLIVPSYSPARDRNGDLVPGALLYVYQNKTTIPVTVYANEGLTIPRGNPVEANSSGQFPDAWLDAGTEALPVQYSVAVTDADGRSLGNPSTFDDITPSLALGIINADLKLDADGLNYDPDLLENISAVDRVYTRSEAGAMDTDLLAYLQQGVPIMPILWDATVYVQGVTPTDQSVKFQQMLNAQHTGKTGDVFITKPYYVNTPVTIPEDCGIYGVSQGGEEMTKADNASKRPGVIVLGPAGSIICSNKARIRNVAIISLDAMTQPTTLASAVSRIAAWAGTAIEIPAFSADVTITENYIIGFDTAINTNLAERHNICANKIDCHWGVKSALTFDTSRAEDNHVWPFWPTHIDFPDPDPVYGPDPAYMRRGAGFYSNGPNDGWLITNNLVFGFKDGIWIQGSTNPASIGMDLDHAPNASGRAGIIATGNTFGSCKRRWIRCGAGDGIVQGTMMGGSSGNFGIELKTGCGYWTFDNIHGVDALNVEAGTGFVTMFSYNGADLPKITMGKVVAYNNVVYDYRAFGSDVQARKNADEVFTGGVEAVVTLNTKGADSLGEFDTSTSVFTAKVRGRYMITGCVGFTPSTTSLANYGLYLYLLPLGGSWTKVGLLAQNFVINSGGLVGMPFSDCIHMDAGASIRIQFVCNQSATVKSDTNVTYLRVYRLPTSRA
jgi:hypothetical protein